MRAKRSPWQTRLVSTVEVRLPLLPELVLGLAPSLPALWASGEPPYWAVAWVGGQALARHVLDHPEAVAGKRVLDFGTGSGVVALAAARAGGLVVAVDVDAAAIVAVEANARLNGVRIDARCVDLVGTEVDADVVLAGDVCYAPAMAARVVPWLFETARRGIEVLLADPGRKYLPERGLREIARYAVPGQGDVEAEAVRPVGIHRLVVT